MNRDGAGGGRGVTLGELIASLGTVEYQSGHGSPVGSRDKSRLGGAEQSRSDDGAAESLSKCRERPPLLLPMMGGTEQPHDKKARQ